MRIDNERNVWMCDLSNGIAIRKYNTNHFTDWGWGSHVITPSNGPIFKNNDDWWQGAVNFCAGRGMRLPTIEEAQNIAMFEWWGKINFWTLNTDNLGSALYVNFADRNWYSSDRNNSTIGVVCVISE